MGELPAARAERLQRTLGLSADSARQLAFRAELGDYFEAALAAAVEPAPPAQALANWISGDLLARLQEARAGEGSAGGEASTGTQAIRACSPRRSPRSWASPPPSRSASAPRGRCSTGWSPRAAIRWRSSRPRGSRRSAAGRTCAAVVAAALAANADAAERVRAGNAKAIGPIVGYVMRETKGRADGGEVTKLVNEQLGI